MFGIDLGGKFIVWAKGEVTEQRYFLLSGMNLKQSDFLAPLP